MTDIPEPIVADRSDVAAVLALREQGRYGEAEGLLHAWLAAHPSDLEGLALLAHVQLLQGKAADAQATHGRAAAAAPAAPATRRTAARLLLRGGKADSAVEAARAAWEAEPSDPENMLVLGTALTSAGRLAEGAALAEALLARDPGRAEAFVVLAQAAVRDGRDADAATATENALRLKPHLPLWTSLGSLRLRLGEEDRAEAAFRRTLEANPNDLIALINLGELARRDGRLAEAQAHLRRATALAPQNADAWSNLGAVLQQQGEYEQARVVYERALQLDPKSVAAHVNLGRLLAGEGRNDAAEASCHRAIEIDSGVAAAHFTLAGVLRRTNRLDEAEAAYRRTLALDPEFLDAMAGLADTLMAKNDVVGGRVILDELLVRRPTLESLLQARLVLSVIPASREQMEQERADFMAGLAEAGAVGTPLEHPEAAAASCFYLAYQGQDDRPVVEALDRLYTAKAPDLRAVSPHVAAWRCPDGAGRRIKVGFVSEFLRNHTIGRLYRGLVARLDRRRFEVIVAHLPKAAADHSRGEISALADKALDLPRSLEAQRDRLGAEQLDVIVYTDIGMALGSYLLAQARLAPVQAVSWGHPDTSGLSSLDYFVSADSIEAPGAEAHYTERLIRLDRLPCVYEQPAAVERQGRRALGLPERGALYGCLQSLFKMHPDFDAVLADIVARDPQGWLVFLEGQHPNWSAALRARWAAWPGLNERVLFMPRRPREQFMALLAGMDVLLDPPHFGSGNTLYEAMATGAPVITWPGAFARGRIVAGAYRQMGVGEELMVETLDDYAAKAIAVANDPRRRATLGLALKAAAGFSLFDDERAARSFEAFLEAAVAAAARGEHLPAGWRSAGLA